jgi:hypothetical protein
VKPGGSRLGTSVATSFIGRARITAQAIDHDGQMIGGNLKGQDRLVKTA